MIGFTISGFIKGYFSWLINCFMSRVYAKLYSPLEATGKKKPFHLIKALYMTKCVFSVLFMHRNINCESFQNDESSTFDISLPADQQMAVF